MKRVLFIALLFSVVAIISQSCKKDDAEMKNKNKKSLKSTLREISSNPTEAKIMSFIERMDSVREHPGYPEGASWNYSLDSTVWYIEAALDYEYAFPNTKRSFILFDSAYISLNINTSNEINIREIELAYENSISVLREKFDSIQAEHKFLASIDYVIESTSSTSLNLVLYYYFSKYSVNLPDGDWAVNGGDVGNGGLCGTNQYINFDGTNKLEQEIFNANFKHQFDVGFTDKKMSYDWYSYIVVDNNFNYSPCNLGLVYDEETYNPNGFLQCLNLSRMNVYESNMVSTMNNYQSNTQYGFVFVDIFWAFKLVAPNQKYHHYYDVNVTTGKEFLRDFSPKNDFMQ